MSNTYIEIPAYGSPRWKGTAPSAPNLPVLGNTRGDVRQTLDTMTLYTWDGASSWVAIATPGAAIALDGLIGDVGATGPGVAIATINPNVISNTKLARMPSLTIKGNDTGGTANASDLTVSQVTTMLSTNFVLKAGDTMTGALSVPDFQLYQATNNLHFYYDIGPGVFTIDSPQSIKLNSTSASLQLMSGTDVQIVNLGNGSFIQLSASVVTQTSGGAQIIADGPGGVYITSASSQPIQFQSNLGIENHFTNSADYSIVNDTFSGDVMRAYGSGDLTFHTYNLSNMTFNSDLDTLFTTNTVGGRLITSQQITLRDPVNDPSTDQIIIKALDGNNFFMGLNNFTTFNAGDLDNLVIGVDSLQASAGGSNNLVFGNASLTGIDGAVSGSDNVAIGKNVLYLNVNGSLNVGMGTAALFNNASGSSNFALGARALQGNTTGSNNVAIGSDAGKLSNANNSLYIGTSAGQSNINGDSVVYIGGGAGALIEGSANIAIGSGAMSGASGATANSNISIGLNSLGSISSGRFNTIISSGDGATGGGFIITTGSHNMVLGYNADVPSASADGQLSIANYIYGTNLTAEGTTVASGFIGFGVKGPTARLQIQAGLATASTAPLKFTSGTNLTTPEAGAIEYNGSDLQFTPTSTRYVLDKVLRGSSTLNFGSTAAGTSTDLTITISGVADGDPVYLGVPNASTLANGVFTAWASAANTVTVRFTNTNLVTALDPASGTFKVIISK